MIVLLKGVPTLEELGWWPRFALMGGMLAVAGIVYGIRWLWKSCRKKE